MEYVRFSIPARPKQYFWCNIRRNLFKNKIHEFKRYGVSSPSQSVNIKNKISLGLTKHIVDGRTLDDISNEFGISYTYVVQLHRRLGDSLVQYLTDNPISKDGSSIEYLVRSNILDKLGIKYEQQPNIDGLKPDFFLPDSNLVIECDGLYWHSEANNIGRTHHLDRRKKFEAIGLRFLSFREDEITDPLKFDIISSIILNAIGTSFRVFARKLQVSDIGSNFFDENHLMGIGTKKSGIGLSDSNGPVIGMTFKRVPNEVNSFEIDRVCTRKGFQVVGGMSRLISVFRRKHPDSKIRTFVDRRYGSGSGLLKMGFRFVHEYPSFRWTNFRRTEHRLKFRKDIPPGWSKIWDCGQAKFVFI